ncbi:MAG: hypothetical protein IJA10_10310 [Lachnospiraceae bacterium]|nr:hypothetical protein [Lachnospiraceae bacterium]
MGNVDSLSMLDRLQDAVIDENKTQEKSNKTIYHFDKLKMYFGEEHVYKGIIILTPTIGDILEIGEEKFYQALSPFLYNSTSIRVFLWDKCQTDWNKVKDIEVFSIMNQMVQDKEPLNLLFKNVSFNDFKFVPAKREINSEEYEPALYSESQNILLYEDDYMHIAEYIREMLNVHPKVEKAKGKTAKAWIIQEDKMNEQNKKEENSSTLLSLVSACVNHPGFKYKLQELKDIGIYQFMDSVKRLQKYESSTAAMKGLYSGFVDGKSLNPELLNFMGDV